MKKVNNKKGFTLAELLVVIAILAILVAIAVPIFTGTLDKAEETVKDANLRSAKSEAMVKYLTEEKSGKIAYDYKVDAETHEITLTEKTDASGATEAATDKLTGTVIVGE